MRMRFPNCVVAALQLFITICNSEYSSYTNPILPGFHPDPSCIFVPEWNNTYFCTSSTFNYFPGLPIYASRDLVHWKHVSNAISRPEQLPYLAFVSRGTSGIYAPTLRFREGEFHIITTTVNQALPRENLTRWDNFVVTTTNPYDSASWSDPIQYYGPGIDPSPFWDQDGVLWVSSIFNSSGIVHAPVDLSTGEVTLPYRSVWNGTGGASPEGAHIYQKDGWYYIIIAEGGTREKHQVTMARSRDLHGPYEPHPDNPVLTAYLSGAYFQAVGHIDLFQDDQGQWWAVGLAVRAGGSYSDNPYGSNLPMGRETWLMPVQWDEDDWPIFRNVTGRVSGNFSLPQPSNTKTVQSHGDGPLVDADDKVEFKPGTKLPTHFLHWRLPVAKNYQVSPVGHRNSLKLRSSMLNLTGYDGDSTLGRGQTFVARRQAHTRFRYSIEIDWANSLTRDGMEVGVSIMQDQSQHFDLGVVTLKDSTGQKADGGLRPYMRFRGISTTPFRPPEKKVWIENVYPLPATWANSRLKFQIEAVNETHYAFSAGIPDSVGGLRVFGYCRGDQLVPYYSGE